ncbi:hypothetical protein [Brachybacterium aquaticum]|uniref:Uncharacterized protein n=1 Tax=Brachybacterium aquaticum TaxID=1432564 RepID=A0A841AAG1_9MICO|nr:hypothetical protein [Brachybacterium aquaticum]MBB5830355.1 hypothetical protein [Brachybacterium aquaticum]
MEINPFESRLRMLQQIDGVQMQREAAPDEETAGCPGCPYFWTCPVPHRGEEVRAPQEIDPADVEDQVGPRRAYVPRDESDVGWTDVWVDEDGLRIDPDELVEELPDEEPRGDGLSDAEEPAERQEPAEGPGEESAEDQEPPSRGRRRRWFFGRR